jgi:hypothetical protein
MMTNDQTKELLKAIDALILSTERLHGNIAMLVRVVDAVQRIVTDCVDGRGLNVAAMEIRRQSLEQLQKDLSSAGEDNLIPLLRSLKESIATTNAATTRA